MTKNEKKLTIVKEGQFLGTKCNFYKDENNSIFMTRNQIGEALKYERPDNAINVMHSRKSNKERMDKFSTNVATTQVEGNREVTRDIIFYSERGIYEICRISRQPVASDFYDWVYDQIELIRRNAGAIQAGREKEFLDNYFPNLSEDTKIMMVNDLEKVIKEKQKEIDEMKPMVDDWKAFLNSKGNLTMNQVAKSLNVDNLGRNNLFALLRKKEILRHNNEPYQRFVKSGYFEVFIKTSNGVKYPQTVVTGKGLAWINKQMKKWEVA